MATTQSIISDEDWDRLSDDSFCVVSNDEESIDDYASDFGEIEKSQPKPAATLSRPHSVAAAKPMSIPATTSTREAQSPHRAHERKGSGPRASPRDADALRKYLECQAKSRRAKAAEEAVSKQAQEQKNAVAASPVIDLSLYPDSQKEYVALTQGLELALEVLGKYGAKLPPSARALANDVSFSFSSLLAVLCNTLSPPAPVHGVSSHAVPAKDTPAASAGCGGLSEEEFRDVDLSTVCEFRYKLMWAVEDMAEAQPPLPKPAIPSRQQQPQASAEEEEDPNEDASSTNATCGSSKTAQEEERERERERELELDQAGANALSELETIAGLMAATLCPKRKFLLREHQH